MADKWQVELLLREFKKHWVPNCFVVPREKNNQALAELGLTPFQRREFILNLSAEDYSEGPVPDKDEKGDDVWVFGIYDIDGTEIYVKLKLKYLKDGALAKCISFHKAAKPLKYPLRIPEGGK